MLDAPAKAATLLRWGAIDRLADSAACDPVFGSAGRFAGSSGIRSGAARWSSGNFAGFNLGFELLGSFANSAELAFDGIVGGA